MSQPSCASCKFWADARCRRYPPVFTGHFVPPPSGGGAFDPVQAFPVTPGTAWCGEYAPAPEPEPAKAAAPAPKKRAGPASAAPETAPNEG